MYGNCDLVTAWEDGGIGGLVVLIAGALLAWWKSKSKKKGDETS